MLQQKYRFHGHGSLRYVYQHGKTYRTRMLALKIVKNSRRAHGRCAVVVGRKVLKSAVGRNRIRRRIYEIIRLQWPRIEPGRDMVITVYDRSVLELPYEKLQQQLVQLFQDAHVWQESPNETTKTTV